MAKILLVDDSKLSRQMARGALAETSHSIVEADDGMQGLLAHAEHAPDCIVTDLLMPKMGGHEFVEKLREIDPVTPIIVVTSDIQDATRDLFRDLFIQGFLNKPVNPRSLVECLNEALLPQEGVAS